MRASGVRGLLVYWCDYRCSHSTTINGDRRRYTSKRNCDYIDSRQVWRDLVAKFANEMAAAIENVGGYGDRADSIDCLSVSGALSISFRIARWCPGKKKHRSTPDSRHSLHRNN
jgi:hypothetical protein